MTAPYYGLLDQSAVARMLAQMTGGANMPQQNNPTFGPTQGAMPQPPGLLQPTPPFNPNAQTEGGLMAQGRSTSPADDPNHEHRKGLRGKIRHLLGGDRIAPEVANLLNPDQKKRLLNMSLLGQFGGGGEQDIALNMVGLTEMAKQQKWSVEREKQRADILKAFPPPSDPNAMPEYVAQIASLTATAPIPDPEWAKELGATYGQVRERPTSMPGARLVTDIPDGKGGLLQRLVMPDGEGGMKVVYEAPQAASTGSPFGSGSEGNMVMRLRNDYRQQPAIKNARTIETSYNRIKNTQDTAVGDLSLIFAYMKMLDPESVVRETEFANAQNTAGVPDQVRNLYNRVREGVRLNPEQRKQFRAQAALLAKGAKEGAEKSNAEYRLLAERFGIDPRLIFTEDDAIPRGRPSGLPNAPPPR